MSWFLVAGVAGSVIGGGLAAKGAKEAAETGAEGQAEASRIIAEQADEARKMIFQLVPIGEQNLQTGAQAALNVLGQSIGPQAEMARGGNIAAQETLISGLPMQRAATLGRDVDYSQLQPYRGGDIPAIDYQLPQFQSAIMPEMLQPYQEQEQQSQQTDAAITSAFQEILGRDPDASGLAYYRQMAAPRGLLEPSGMEAMRQDLMGSAEYVGQGG